MNKNGKFNEEELKELWEKFLKNKDMGALKALYEYYHPKLIGLAFRYMSDRQKALGKIHDAFLRLYDNTQEQNEEIKNYGSYLMQIVRNQCLTEKTSEKRHREINEIVVKSQADSYEESFEFYLKNNNDEKVRQIVKDSLKGNQLKVILLYFFDNLDFEEISKILQKNVGHIRVIKHDALKNLRKTSKIMENFQIRAHLT